MEKQNLLNVALSQIAPVWLDKEATLQKIYFQIQQAADRNTELIIFGEGVLPGYPFWLALTDCFCSSHSDMFVLGLVQGLTSFGLTYVKKGVPDHGAVHTIHLVSPTCFGSTLLAVEHIPGAR